jgi:hypothetical protein
MAKKYVRESVPLSRFGVLVAQLESIVASAVQQPPDALLCFDLLSDLISAIDEEPKVTFLFSCPTFFFLFFTSVRPLLLHNALFFKSGLNLLALFLILI